MRQKSVTDKDLQDTSTLQEKIQKLLAQKLELEERNAALKTLVAQNKQDVADFKQQVFSNVRDLVMPYLERLQDTGLNEDQQVYLSVSRANLSEIVSSFNVKLGLSSRSLTPREIEVANLVQMGKSSKQVASILKITTRAVEFHRDSLRKKLGLKKSKKNLRAYLSSI